MFVSSFLLPSKYGGADGRYDRYWAPTVQDWVTLKTSQWPLITVHSRLLSWFFNETFLLIGLLDRGDFAVRRH